MCHHGAAWNTTVIANNYMEHLYETAMQTAPLQPTLWFRYVEDIFAIWLYGNISMSTLTSTTPNIQFTVEEKDRKLPFLDVQVTRSPKWLSTVFTESLPTQIAHVSHCLTFAFYHLSPWNHVKTECLKSKGVYNCVPSWWCYPGPKLAFCIEKCRCG